MSKNCVSDRIVSNRVGLQAALHKESTWSRRTAQLWSKRIEQPCRTVNHRAQRFTADVFSSGSLLQSQRFGLAFLVIALALILNSCGFHLRGAMPLSDALMQVTLEQKTDVLTSLERSVQQALEQKGASVVGSRIALSAEIGPANTGTDATTFIRLRLTDAEFSRFPLSTQANNQVGSYEYQYQMRYQVEDLVRPARPKLTGEISSRQTQSAFGDNPISQEQAEAQLEQRLEKELAERLVRLLALQTRHWTTRVRSDSETSVSSTGASGTQAPSTSTSAIDKAAPQPAEITHAP